MLGQGEEHLKNTDVSEEFLEFVRKSHVQNVVFCEQISIIGRRGVLQSSFSIKELKDLAKIPSLNCIVIEEEIQRSLNDTSVQEMSESAKEAHPHTARLLRKKLDVFKGNAFQQVKEADIDKVMLQGANGGRKNVVFRFLAHPTSSKRDENGKIISIECERNRLEGAAYRQKPVSDHSLAKFSLRADLAVSAIGYYSLPIPGIGNFDESNHVLPNSHGCVLEAKNSDKFRVGIYCAGWVKTGAKGIIDTTMKGAEETYNNLKNHILGGKLEQKEDPWPNIEKMKTRIGKKTTSFDDWLKIDDIEKELGEQRGKVREKLSTNELIWKILS